MKKLTIIILFLIVFFIDVTNILFSQPKREIRSVWLTTNYQLDWPSRQNYDSEIQKRELIEILDNLKSKNFNTVYFQVRSQGSVMYKSDIEPWSPFLTGSIGKSPNYDPLDFLIKEARNRNFEVHAWLNVFLIKTGDLKLQFSNPPHIIFTRPEWIRLYREKDQNTYWLDPGLPEVRDYIKHICIEIVKNYDIDGIHLDYIRYPGPDFDDSLAYNLFGSGKNLEDFRRENINKLIEEIYDTLNSIKPHIKIGSAPLGIYENLIDATGLEAKKSVFQDSREWLRRKKHDYIAPQIYWDLQHNPKFETLVRDWTKNSFNRQIVIGIGAYNENVLREIEDQIEITRKYNSAGQSFFRYENIKNLNFNSYKFLANIPPMKWKDSISPNPPFLLSGRNLKNKLGLVELVWGIPEPAQDGDTARYYNIYRSLNKNINRNSPLHLYAFSNTYYFYDFIRKPEQTEYFYQVSSLDKLHNESEDATEIIKVKLDNLVETLSDAYPVDIVSISVDKNLITLLIELKKSNIGKIELFDLEGNLFQKIYDGNFESGLNYIQFEVPKTSKKRFELKIFLRERIESIRFSLK